MTIVIVAVLALLQGYLGAAWQLGQFHDGARRVEIPGPSYLRHLGLIGQNPDFGTRQLVFSYCALLDNRYRIFTGSGNPWGLPAGGNYFDPSLAPDDASLLVETVARGRSEIRLSPGPGLEPRFVAEGQSPSWHPDGRRFVFERDGRLNLFDLENWGQSPLEGSEGGYGAVVSADGKWVLFCRGEDGGSPRQTRKGERQRTRKSGLWRLDMAGKTAELLYEAEGRIESPSISQDGGRVAFSLDDGGNQDIWVLNLATRKPIRLTSNPALDRDPVWDEEGKRILFTSDRGRGLGCTTLYWTPLPEDRRSSVMNR